MDLIRGSNRYIVHNPSMRRSLLCGACIVLGFGLIAALAKMLSSDAEGLAQNAANAFGFTAMFMAFVLVLMPIVNSVALLLTQKKGLMGEHELEIDERGLSERTKYNDTLDAWDHIHAVCESKGFWFVRVIQKNQPCVHVIPKAGIVEGDLDAFIEKLRMKIEQR